MNTFLGALPLIALFGAYWVPSITAARRHVPNAGSVAVINLFLGWTLIGWVVALAMACRSQPAVTPEQPQVTAYQQPEPQAGRDA